MPRELVYLFELDSVRKANDEIICARKILYETIVDEGKCVVLTFNQLTDSWAFLCPIRYQKNAFLMDHYMELFKAGALKISQFYSPVDKCTIRTPAQYIMNSLEKAIQSAKSESTFIFSSLPIARNNTAALQMVLNAFKYCDLELLKDIPGVDQGARNYIRRYVKWMLDLSLLDLDDQESVYIGRKQSGYWQFSDYLDILITAENPFSSEENRKKDFQKAWEIIKKVNANFNGNRFARSNWLDSIERIDGCSNIVRELAKEMVNLCYNFGVESSIDGISNPCFTDEDVFVNEFGKRIGVMADAIDAPKSPTVIELIDFPDWEHAAHIATEADIVIRKTQPESVIDQPAWRKICWRGQWRKFKGACVVYLLFLIIDFVANLLEPIIDTINLADITFLGRVIMAWNSPLCSLLWSILFSIFSVTIISLISSRISERLSVPDITEIFRTIKEVWSDVSKLLRKGDRS